MEILVEKLRRERLSEIRDIENSRFGQIYPIGRDDYTREVTEASKVTFPGDPGRGTGVVCILYKDGYVLIQPGSFQLSRKSRLPRSERAFEHARILARRHPKTKFVSIVGDKCIQNLPESRQPMLIIYRDGEVQNQVVAWGGDRERRLEGESDPPTRSTHLTRFDRTGSRVNLMWCNYTDACPRRSQGSRGRRFWRRLGG